MAYTPFNPDLKVGTAVYNEQAYMGIETLDNARRNGSPELRDYLNTAAVYAYGSNASYGEQNFPILFQTQGMGKKKAVTAVDGLVRGFLLGKPKKTSVVAKTIHAPNGNTGKGGQKFSIIFRDRQFMKNQLLLIGGLGNGSIQLQVAGDPQREGKGWRYEVRIFGGDRNLSVPYKFLQEGAVWSGGVVRVSREHSRGTESRSYFPYQTKNYLNTIRQSINVAGNIANKVLNFKFTVDGQTFQLYYEWEKFLTERTWNEARDIDLVISRLTMDTDGIIENYDSDSGKPIVSGMGLWDQIPSSNSLYFGELTESLIENYITDMVSITGQMDRDPGDEVIVDIMCGEGFLMLIDKALKRNMNLLTLQPSADLFVTKNSDGGLTSGAYFTRYKHRSGVVFRFTNYPGFNRGVLADSAERHPQYPNMPMTAFNAMIMNFGLVSTGGGQTEGNINFLYEEGREYIEGTVQGMAKIEGKQGGNIATDMDASALHMMCTQGIHVNYPMSLGKMECKLS